MPNSEDIEGRGEVAMAVKRPGAGGKEGEKEEKAEEEGGHEEDRLSESLLEAEGATPPQPSPTSLSTQ